MHCIYVFFHWPRHSKAIIIEKVIPCFRKFHPWKKTKTKKKHWSSQSKEKKSPTCLAYLKHQLLCNHRQKSFRRRADIYSPTTYIFYNTYKSIRSRQLHFVTHLAKINGFYTLLLKSPTSKELLLVTIRPLSFETESFAWDKENGG